MPYPTQINRELVLQAACHRLEAEGLEALSLHRLAAELGVKAPSLYRYFANKSALLQAVNEVTVLELMQAMQEGESLEQMFFAYRRFALANPRAYQLAYASSQEDLRLKPELAEQFALPLEIKMAAITGPEKALSALRGAWALVHGFVMLELHGQFQRGGDLGIAFEQAITAYLKGCLPD